MAAQDSLSNGEQKQGTLTVVRPASPAEAVKFETFIKIASDGSVTAYNGHVDLGTGIRTARRATPARSAAARSAPSA